MGQIILKNVEDRDLEVDLEEERDRALGKNRVQGVVVEVGSVVVVGNDRRIENEVADVLDPAHDPKNLKNLTVEREITKKINTAYCQKKKTAPLKKKKKKKKKKK